MTSRLESAILHLCDQFDELGGEAAADVTADIRARLGLPLRLAVVGRVKAGKSTLVNALVGARVAATDEAECTKLVTHYVFDPPDRAEIILTDGHSIFVNIVDGRLPDPLPVAADKISHLVVHLHHDTLRDYTLIDTPGLATTTAENEARTRSSILGLDGPRQTDAVIYVFRDQQFQSDVEFLREFRIASGGASSNNSIGVLSHADGFGDGAWGEQDPIKAASARARLLAQQRSGEVATVVAVAGKLAESAAVGRVREEDAAALNALSATDDINLVAGQVPINQDRFKRLVDLIDDYGIRFGRAHSGNAVLLNRWLEEVSGVQNLRLALSRQYVGRYPQLKARQAFILMEQSVRQMPRPMPLIRMLSDARGSPELHPLAEVTAWESLIAAHETHPLEKVLDRLLQARDDAGRVGLPSSVSTDEIVTAATKQASLARDYVVSDDPVIVAAAVTVSQSFALVAMRNATEQNSPGSPLIDLNEHHE